MEDIFFVYMTAPDRATACNLAETLVRERLAACANVLDGMESFYWWQGELHRTMESVCILKTPVAGYAALEQRARELHPYEVPCIVALPVSRGHEFFLQWVGEETRPGRDAARSMEHDD